MSMVSPRVIADAIVTALQSIPVLVDAMGEDATRIAAHHYLYGAEQCLYSAVATMPAPSILIAWKGTIGGNYDGATIRKHHFYVNVRCGTAADLAIPLSYEDIWTLMINSPILGGTQTIENVQLVAGIDIMDTPSALHVIDEDKMDYLQTTFIFPELGF